ncbi:hypothetical protein UFOVP99_9 [uncultured Caudovirales phage]|uniref:Uncharacterized protein n=1 Tax=uncultured Caudovirales phage TaxID=2100421 RepID=A0A6J5L8I2_9CAUD|nr:hypothetical protein UFOVP99_9 [uncultured Caudovirales phage]
MATPEQNARIALALVQDNLLVLRRSLELLGVDAATAQQLQGQGATLRLAIMEARGAAMERAAHAARCVA